jgi:hypothetical protein
VTLEDGSKVSGEPLNLWQCERDDLRRAVQLHEALVAQDPERVEAIGQEIPPFPGHHASLGSQGGLVHYQTTDDERLAQARGWDPEQEHVFHYGRLALSHRINRFLMGPLGIGSVVALGQPGVFSVELWPKSLLGAAWFQLAHVVEGSAEVQRCVACASPFIVTHTDNRRGHRQYCTDSCKQRSYRARRAKRAAEPPKRQRKSARKNKGRK